MTKVIDTFLFFQELDLAEIRMEYLDDLVDHFVIVEAAQTFSGKPKPFNFEANRARFAKFDGKIIYIKIEDRHENYTSVIRHLASQADATSERIRSLLEAHMHYDKSHLAWVLDSYHRECIHFGLDQIAKPDDIVLLSDLDEIPMRARVAELISAPPQHLVDLQQNEFRYFLNFHKDNDWLGTIAGRPHDFANKSLNELRADSKSERKWFKDTPLLNGGYHFTSVGDIETIRKKIESWAHQEYNTDFTMSELEKNIRSGQDIFNRETGTTLSQVDIATSNLFDADMRRILLCYPSMISSQPIDKVPYSLRRDIVRRIRKLVSRLGYELRKQLAGF